MVLSLDRLWLKLEGQTLISVRNKTRKKADSPVNPVRSALLINN